MTATLTGDVDLATATDAGALGQAAFERINAREFDAARAILDRALALHPGNAMLAHTRIHLDTASGTWAEGAAYMRTFLAEHDPNSGINMHNSWHLAQLELQLGNPAAALDWHVRVVGPGAANVPMTFFSATSLLWRVGVTGYGATLKEPGVELPWETVRAGVPNADASPVSDLGRAMIFIATQDDAALAALTAGLGRDSERREVDEQVLVPTIRGLRAFWHGDYEAAAAALDPVQPLLGQLSRFPEHQVPARETLEVARRRARS
jgi:hypothetical protein